jgi:hypothetical protein
MNDLPTRPATPPLPPPDGAFRRVRRRAFVRKLRVPAAGAVAAAFLVGAVTVAPSPSASDRLQVTNDPAVVRTTDAPYETAGVDETPSTAPLRTLTPGPELAVTPTPTPSPDDEGGYEGPIDGVMPPVVITSQPPRECNPVSDPDAAITGVVVDRAGTPLSGITVTSFACNADKVAWLSGHRYTATDAQGRFSIPCHDDHWAVAGPFEWYTGERTSDHDVGFAWLGGGVYAHIRCGSEHRIVLPDAATVNVQLVDAAGEPVAAATDLSLFVAEDGATNFAGIRTDGTGHGSFTGLAPGSYVLWDSAGRPTRFTLAEGQTLDVTVRADPSTTPTPSTTGGPSVTPSSAPEPSATP